ncbi:MAG: hypothetical protein ACP5HS_09135 [Anaerolineae bacterium]
MNGLNWTRLHIIALICLLGFIGCTVGSLGQPSSDVPSMGTVAASPTLTVTSSTLEAQPTVTATARPSATAGASPSPTATQEVESLQPSTPTLTPRVQPTATPTSLETAAGSGPPAERIEFPAGATATTVSDHLPANGEKLYVMRIAAGQFMEIDATAAGNRGLRFAIAGADGTVLHLLGQPHLKAVAPSTQDYYLRLVSDVDPVDYTLSILIPVRIAFSPGATSATVLGSLSANGIRSYVLQAQAGQSMFVETTTTQGAVKVIVAGVDGVVLVSGNVATGPSLGPLLLPSTQDYLIAVVETRGEGAHYQMRVEIPGTASATATPDAETIRLTLAPGATMGVVESTIPAQGSQQVLVRVAAGQWMEAMVPPQQGIELWVTGSDGTVLQQGGGPVFRGVVPSTQDYILTLVNYGRATSYHMIVTIPIRISFASGSTGAIVQGSLMPNMIDHYVIRALEGQVMYINTPVTSGQVTLAVYGVDGTILSNEGTDAYDFTATLPSTQDYRIDIQAVGGAVANYALDVTVW